MKKHFSTIILTAALSASTLSCFAQKQPESETGLSAMVPDKEQLDSTMPASVCSFIGESTPR